MELAGLLSLPVEILHSISLYFSVKEILNCSETCHYLRMAFNDNRVWRRFVPVKALQLEEQEQILEPGFQLKDILTPLCDYRVHYMRLNHLLNNWNTANLVKYTKKTSHSYASGVFNVPKGRGQIIYKDRYIFLSRFKNDIESDGIEVWDVGKEPIVHLFLSMKNIKFDHFYLVDSKLVVVECKKVCVYQIHLPDKYFTLLYSFIITDNEAMWIEDKLHRERCDFRCVGWSSYNIGQYLVSNKCCDEGSIIHVWDILNSTKVGAFALPMNGLFSVSVESHENNEWLLRGSVRSFSHSFFFLFNIKEKTFCETCLKMEGRPKQIILFKSHILVVIDAKSINSDNYDSTIYKVYDFKKSEEVKERHFSNTEKNRLLSTTTIVNGFFIIFCLDCFLKIDALTLETIEQFQCELDFRLVFVQQLNVFGLHFLVVLSGDGKLYMWNVNKEQLAMPLEVSFRSNLHLNDSMTKLVSLDYSKIQVFHFW